MEVKFNKDVLFYRLSSFNCIQHPPFTPRTKHLVLSNKELIIIRR